MTGAGLAACHTCHLPVRLPVDLGGAIARCPRCRSRVHRRKVNSIARTWALVIAALVFYVPANLMPVMTVVSLGKAQSDTILSGVMYLVHHGQWPLALIIFIASVFVPMLKLLMLMFLLISVQRRSKWRPVDRTRIYRITELVGRWSMVDIYVVAILVALVKLGNLATIEAGAGALFFGAVVVVTMIAAESFDPRLIWDHAEGEHG